MAVLLVRHGDAGDRDDWDGPDHLRPLTRRGISQAEALVAALAGFPVERVLSSPFLRCTQTVEPLSRDRGTGVEPSDALAEGNGRAALELVQGLAGAPVVLCTHGDVIGELLETMPVPRRPRMQKGSVWILEAEAGAYAGARYLPPPA